MTISPKFKFPAFSNVDLPIHKNARCHNAVDLKLVSIQSLPLNALGAILGITGCSAQRMLQCLQTTN
jgi:hypothetical protein